MSEPSRPRPKRRSLKLTFALAVLGSGLVMAGAPKMAHATNLTVNTAEDVAPDANGKFPTDGKCSLRAAIRAAESNSNAHDVDCPTGVPDADDVIVLDAALAGQTFRLTYAIDGNVQPFDTIISGGPLSIVGETENAADFVISGEGLVRPFTVGYFNIAAASLTLANLTVANGDGTANGAFVGGLDGFGGAIYLGDNGTTGSTLTLDNVVLKNNSAAYNGGAVYGTMLTINNNGGAYVGNSSTRGGAISVSSGPFTLNGYAVAFEGNRASDKGGAIYSNPGNEPMLVHLERSLLRDNAAVSAGGVVYVDSSRREKVFELHDSTATGNSSVFFAQANFQSFEILRSTFVDSGEIWRAGAGFIANSIVTGNSSCSYVGGPGIGGSRNLINAPGCGLGNIGDVTGLGPLAQNGGPKVQQTFGLQPGSNAIDNGDPAYCGVVDARSIARGVEGDGTVNAPQAGDCDIGAYEFAKAVVNFAQGTPVVNEGDGTTGVSVRLRLLDPDMQTLTRPLVINVAQGPGSTARIGPSLTLDDLDVPGNTVTFPTGATDGATANLVVNLHQDFVAELNGETAVLQLTTVDTPGVSIAEPNTASVVIQDDDQAGIVMIETGGATRVSEANTTEPDTIGVRLQSQPDYEPGTTTPADVTMTVVPDRDCTIRRGATVDPPSSSPIVTQIRNADWQTVTMVEVFAVDDPYDEDLRDEADPHPCELRFTFTSLDPVYSRTHDAVEVDVIDDETARVVMTEIARPTFVEGRIDTALWTVRLTTPPDPGKPLPATPRAPTRVRFTPNEDCDAGAGPGVARDLTFTSANWNVAQQVQITVTQDPFVELLHECVVQPTVLGDDPVYADLSNPPVFSGTPPTIELDIQDYDPPNGITDDPPFVDITTSSLDVDEGTGTTDTISVVLRRAPVDAPVLVQVDAVVDPRIGDEQVELWTGNFTGWRRDTGLRFTSANWDIPQTIDVRAFDDDFDEPATHTGALEVSAESTAPGFSDTNLARLVVDGVEIAGTAIISADVADDDTSEIVITHTGGGTQVDEAGGSDTIGTVLATHPYAADVTVTLTAGADCLVDGASSKSVVIPAELWDTRHRPHPAPTPVPFVVTAVDDEIVEADPHDCLIQVSGASDDTLYDALPDVTATARVTDDDIPEITVDTRGGIEVTEAGPTDTFTAVLGNEPEANVAVEFPGTAGQAGTNTHTFTSSNWNVPHTYTVTAVDDDVDESTPHTDTLAMNISTTLAGYRTRATLTVDAGPAAPGVEVDVTDDDTAGLTVSPRSVSLVEGGGPDDTFTAVLDSDPVDDVVLSFTANINCTTGRSGHTFDSTNWNQPVTVTVSATDDDIDQQDDRVCSVAIATTSSDPSYDGISDTVTGPVADNDTSGLTLSTTSVSLVEGGAGDSFTAVLDSEPVDDVALSFTADSNCTTAPSGHTFDSTNWDQPVAVTVTATDDSIDDDRVCSVAIATTSIDLSYDGISDTVTGPVADDDIAGLTVSPRTVSLVEGGPGDTFNAVLDSEPVDDVAVSITANRNCTTERLRHTFASTNWDRPVTVTVTAADDVIDQPDEDRICSLAIATTSGDPSYDRISETVTGPVGDDDVSVCGRRLATLVGTAGDDLLTGTPGPDVIVALGGNDTINGRSREDTICAGAGDDVIRSGAGNDAIWGGAGNDTIRGGAGNDVLSGWFGEDLLASDAGRDTIRGGDGNDTVIGGFGADVLGGQAGDDVVSGQRGDDRLRGGADDDRLNGAAGRDHCRGGTGADSATSCEIAAEIP